MPTGIREIQAALHKKSGFEVLEHKEGTSQLRIAGRQPKDRMGMNTPNWLLVCTNLLKKSSGSKWSLDVSKHHFLRGESIIYSWRLIFQCEGSIREHYEEILKAIHGASHTSRGEITEMPLAGASKDRNAAGGVGRGRGATGTIGGGG